MIDLKASIEHGQRLKAYNAWNKEMPIAVKGVSGFKNAFQLVPDVRAIVPTKTTVEVPEGYIAKIYIDQNAALTKSLGLVTCVQILTETTEVNLLLKNTSDSLATIADGDVLAQVFLEKKVDI